jgi:hypothetical protein
VVFTVTFNQAIITACWEAYGTYGTLVLNPHRSAIHQSFFFDKFREFIGLFFFFQACCCRCGPVMTLMSSIRLESTLISSIGQAA